MTAIRNSPDLERILSLPRRSPDDPKWDALALQLTELLRTPNGKERLRTAQALALHDMFECRGAFCPLGTGEGKTLISLLAPYVLDAKRPLLLQPAGLVKKTDRERDRDYAPNWLVPKNIRLFSYDLLSRVEAEHELEAYQPDLIIVDEAHRLKNLRAAVTRRVARYMAKHPETMFVALSGTVMSKSLMDFWHVILWCLKDKAPVPMKREEAEAWAAALDKDVEEYERVDPGALSHLAGSNDGPDPLTAARLGFQRRLRETPGVITTIGGGEAIASPLRINAIVYDVQPITNQHIKKLRDEMLTPDDWQLSEPVDVWRHARELALGLHYVWNPRPPEEWREARKNWHAFAREAISKSRTLDSEKAVANAIDAGDLQDHGVLEAWRAIRDTYNWSVEPVWHDDSALRLCQKWMAQAPGVVWTKHDLFAEKLSEISGAPYYGAKGLDAQGRFVDDADPTRSAILSIDANRDGRNLQTKWSRNLVTCPPDSPLVWQQMVSRTHRPGQTASAVLVDVLLGCAEHANAWRNAVEGAGVIREMIGAESKLLIAEVNWPDELELASYVGARWER
jgi:hypothetical protein